MKFKMTLGIYAKVEQEDDKLLLFENKIYYEEEFEESWGEEPIWVKEIPYKLLDHVKQVVLEKLDELESTDNKWCEKFRNLYDGYWWDDPHWHDPEITEVIRYWHQGPENIFWLKLEWNMDTLKRSSIC